MESFLSSFQFSSIVTSGATCGTGKINHREHLLCALLERYQLQGQNQQPGEIEIPRLCIYSKEEIMGHLF